MKTASMLGRFFITPRAIAFYMRWDAERVTIHPQQPVWIPAGSLVVVRHEAGPSSYRMCWVEVVGPQHIGAKAWIRRSELKTEWEESTPQYADRIGGGAARKTSGCGCAARTTRARRSTSARRTARTCRSARTGRFKRC